MAIAFVIPNLKGGGAEKVFINIANEISKSKEVYLIVIDSSYKNYFGLISNDVNIHFINSKRSYKAIFKIHDFINKKNIKVVYSTLSHINILFCIVKILIPNSKFKLIVRETNFNSNLKYKIFKLIYVLADKIVYPSEELMDMYSVFKKKSICINNPVSNDILNLINFESEETNFFCDNTLNLVTVGSLTAQKDHTTLIKAISLLNSDKVKLIIVGDGSNKERLLKLIESNDLSKKIKITGFVENPYPILYKADAFILPSLYEGFPNALVEAVVLNKICVVSNFKTGREEILNEYENVFYEFNIGDYNSLANILNNLKKAETNNININQFNKYSLSSISLKYLNII